uniref:Uncharacterized protein n=1 Tax=Parascaris equorum TaxID=6256 RepID=A0A914RMP5_PAREQ
LSSVECRDRRNCILVLPHCYKAITFAFTSRKITNYLNTKNSSKRSE